jgi:hypothetical protein
LIGLLIAAMWFVSASLGYLEEDPNTLKEGYLATNSRGPESFSFVAPIAYAIDYLILFSDKSKTLSIGIVSVFGMVLGAFIDSLLSRDVFGSKASQVLKTPVCICSVPRSWVSVV